jgi:hypothetical protein
MDSYIAAIPAQDMLVYERVDCYSTDIEMVDITLTGELTPSYQDADMQIENESM